MNRGILCVAACVSLVGLPALGGQAVPARSAAELRTALLQQAAEGRLTDDLIALYRAYAVARVQERFADAVPPEFWPWLDSKQSVRDGLLAELDPERDDRVLRSLDTLRRAYGKRLDTYHQLALAFAFVWGRAGSTGVRCHPRAAGRAARLEIGDAFGFYLQNERAMSSPLRQTPWPLLVHVANNDLPMEQRRWVVRKYPRRSVRAFGKLYYDVPYDYAKLEGRPSLGDRPYTLENILKYGGFCGDRTYFASRVLKSLGVPSMFDHGRGERGAHAWVAWIAPHGKGYKLSSSGRFDYDRYYTGKIRDPLTGRAILDRDAELVAAAVGKSYRGYLDALIGCKVYGLFARDERDKGLGVLKDTVTRNAFCARAWRILADACVEGTLPQAQGEQMLEHMLTAFSKYPDLTAEVLGKILRARFATSEENQPKAIAGNLRTLDKAFKIYERARRPDLAVELRVLQGDYLASMGHPREALKVYADACERYATEHYGFLELFRRALNLMEDKEYDRPRLRFLTAVSNRVPKYQSTWNRKHQLVNPAYVTVVRAYVEESRRVGNARLATQWEAKLPRH